MTKRQKDLYIKALNGDEDSINKLREDIAPPSENTYYFKSMFANLVSQADFLTDEQKKRYIKQILKGN